MPATLPWPKMPKQPAKKRCLTPSRSTCCAARKRTSACAVVSRRVRPRGGSGASSAPPSTVSLWRIATLRAEHLVEGVDVRLRVRRRSFQDHLQRTLGMVVEEAVGPLLVAGVHEDLVRLLVEQRAAVLEEVLRDPRRLLHRVDEPRERILVM